MAPKKKSAAPKAIDTTAIVTPIVVHWPTRDLHDVMTTALEGGIRYWAEVRNVVRDVELNPISFEVRANDDAAPSNKWRVIDAGGIALAIAFVISGHVRVGRPVVGQIVTDKGGADAECADVLVQIAAFGKLVYG